MIELKDFRVFKDLKPEELQKLEGLGAQDRLWRRGAHFHGGRPRVRFLFGLQGRGQVGQTQREGEIPDPQNRGTRRAPWVKRPFSIKASTTRMPRPSYPLHGGLHRARRLSSSFLEHHPKVIFRFFEYLSLELKAFQNKLAERSYASSKERLARLILALDRLGFGAFRGRSSRRWPAFPPRRPFAP
jgi:hypothetical protein